MPSTRCAVSRSPTASSPARRVARGSRPRPTGGARPARRRPAVLEEESPLSAPAVRSADVEIVEAPPRRPTTTSTCSRDLDLSAVWPYVNPHMLYAKHLGLRGSFRKLKEAGDPQARRARRGHRAGSSDPAGSARAPCTDSSTRPRTETRSACPSTAGSRRVLHFPRQVAGERLSLADFVRPASAGGRPDSVALLLTTAGEGVRARAEDLKNRGRVPPLPLAPGARGRDRGGRGGVAPRRPAPAVGIRGRSRRRR